MEKSYRIHTNISSDTVLNVNMKQDFDFLEVLSLKLRQRDAYRLHSSNYGVIIGRVLANDAFGIPNAKISVFIERDDNDPVDIENIYPYSEVTSKDDEGRRYNLLPDYSDDDCYRVVGTFPNKRYLLDDDIQLEVYDKYWKYTTVTNNAGDYMIFGVPADSQQVHVDIDLSDIGILSQKPRDFTYRGYDLSEFDSPSQFKASTNFDSLRQIFSQDKSVYVYPFWGDAENGIAAITRCDIQIAYKFEPTCVFMGSIISDNEGNSIGHKCAPNVDNGMNTQLIAGEGTIEMIRRTTDGLVEEYPIQGNALIDSDGVWCYQIPMNLDYVGTDEYGNIVPTDNPSKGIPTRTQVRFRISKTETGDEGFSRHTAKYLVPMNPVLYEGPAENSRNPEIPMTQETTGEEMEKMYNFGSNTPQSCFRDLYWNNVYSVKNFIPKTQVAHRAYAPNYSALKGSNLAEDQNPVPFNKLRVDIPFTYIIICIIFTIILLIITFINTIICGINIILGFFQKIKNVKILGLKPFSTLFGWIPDPIGCISLSAGLNEGNYAYYPGCWCQNGLDNADCPEDMEDDCIKEGGYNLSPLKDRIQRNLALDFKIIKLDFYQDWLNGSLYMPLWYWRKRKKKTFLFGLFTLSGAKNEFCDCDKNYSRLKTFVTCNIVYTGNSLDVNDNSVTEEEEKWHKRRSARLWYTNGLIKGVTNRDGLTAYYYSAFQANTTIENVIPIKQRFRRFHIVRLYSTDIILLGNLNEDNYYGIPQLYTKLPSTTANIPLIATIAESPSDEENDKIPENDTAGDASDSGTVITTGMDWGYNGDSQSPRYKEGLFIDLACTYAKSKAKSCINVERISELGVNLDMTYNMPYSNGGHDIKYGPIDSDGFITKYELDDMENRAMFATLNHIGFIPQDYQDRISGYTTQVQDEHTGYLIPKFKYIYPVDFDGRMQPIMSRYKNGFEQPMYDELDESYVTFRLGAENETESDKNEEGRIRHFYFVNNGEYEMPLYNNSFYFYFGVNKGSTAIDKFNKMFYAPCFQNDKKPFNLDLNTRGKSYCPSMYQGGEIENYEGYAYIDVNLDDIQAPYSYKLLDSTDTEIISETVMTLNRFIIGGYIDNTTGKVKSNPDGSVMYQTGATKGTKVDNEYGDSGLTNQTYILSVTDANGKTISERIELKMPKIAVEYKAKPLGTKFYSTGSTRIDYICTDETQFYGRVRILDFVVDGYVFEITQSEPVGYDQGKDVYKILVTGVTTDVGDGGQITASALISLGAVKSPEKGFVRECLCDTANKAARQQVAAMNMFIKETDPTTYWFRRQKDASDTSEERNTFYMYQPNRFTLTITQICDGKLVLENTTSELVTVNNGANFHTYLSGMPVKFMLGSVNDSSAATIANQSNFYRSSGETSTIGPGLIGWYGLHQETTYRFNMPDSYTLLKNEDTWSDFVTLNTSITSFKSKASILKFKFNAMFSLSKSGYVIEGSTPLVHEQHGGIDPILHRSVIPQYEVYRSFGTMYVLSENNRATGLRDYPNIIGNNYSGYTDQDQQPYFNKYYNTEYVGNYFAAFTQNGGYSSFTGIDDSIKIMKIPNYTKVTPRSTPREKVIGNDEVRQLGGFNYAYAKNGNYQPYLRGMFIDRRFDFNLVIFAPAFGQALNLYSNESDEESKKEKIWKSGRISGWTMNGIEMSYDSEYNIISAETDATVEKEATYANPIKTLEYSYSIPSDGVDDDAFTVYNSEPNMKWESDNPGPSEQIIKRYYLAKFGEFDIRNYFWSYFNEQRLSDEISSNTIEESVPYIFKHPPMDMKYKTNSWPYGYNGDFNMENVAHSFNYPTVRAIDICNIPPGETYDLNITSCCYNIKAVRDTNGTLHCTANGDDGIAFRTQYESPVQFLSPNADSNDFYNVLYTASGIENDCIGKSYRVFSASTADLYFKFTPVSNETFDVYTSAPKVVKVLPKLKVGNKEYDGITYIKTVTTTGEIIARNTLDGVLNDNRVILFHFGDEINVGDDVSTANKFLLSLFPQYDIFLPSNLETAPNGLPLKNAWIGQGPTGYEMAQGTFFWNPERSEYVTSDCNDFENILFKKRGIDLKEARVFTILVNRIYIYKDNDNLQRRLRTIETSELFDCRKILIRVNQETYTGGTLSGQPRTCILCRKLGETDINITVPTVDGATGKIVDDGHGGQEVKIEKNDIQEGSESTSGTGEDKVHIQLITFDFVVHTNVKPENSESEAFADFQMMSYIFRFKNANGDTFDLKPTGIEPEPHSDNGCTILHFTIRWTTSMGVLKDKEWQNNTIVSLYVKYSEIQSNFTYKLYDFKLDYIDQEGDYDPRTKKSSMGDNERKKTIIGQPGISPIPQS